MGEDIFKKILSPLQLNDEAQSYLKEIIQNLPQDLAPDRPGYYSHETNEKLYTEAAERLAQQLAAVSGTIGFAELRSVWTDIVVDYHRNNNWNYPVTDKKPEKILTQEQKTFREMWPYILIMTLGLLVLKTSFFYFGMHSAAAPSTTNTVMLVVTLVVFFGALGFFIWRKNKKH